MFFLRREKHACLNKGHHRFAPGDGWAVTPHSGTFDLEAASLELLRMTIDTPELPSAPGLCEAHSSLKYARARIGDGDFLLPSVSLHFVNRSTMETESTSAVTACKGYLATSVLHVEGEREPSNATSATAMKLLPALPEGMRHDAVPCVETCEFSPIPSKRPAPVHKLTAR